MDEVGWVLKVSETEIKFSTVEGKRDVGDSGQHCFGLIRFFLNSTLLAD